MMNVDLLIKNAAELLTLSPMVKEESGLGIIRNGTVVVKEGKIAWTGDTDQLPKEFKLSSEGHEIDAQKSSCPV